MRHRLAVARHVLIRSFRDGAPVALALAILAAVAVAARVQTSWRHLRRRKPRLVWGPDPIISLKYWSEAMRRRGYDSATYVFDVYAINRRSDFDFVLDELEPRGPLRSRPEYAHFASLLRRGDVFLHFLHGGFLRNTPLRRLEGPLRRLAGKRTVVFPYGSDVAVAGHLGELEEPLFADYPALRDEADRIRDWVDYWMRWADVVIRNWQFGYLPRGDVVWLTQLAIDTDRWAPPREPPPPRAGGEIVVLHAPNHRHVKGTEHLERAVAELREEGHPVRLELLERRPNEEIRRAIADADIVADQFLAGYAMFAIEAMAAGKPVLCNLDSIPGPVRESEAFRAVPVVDTNPTRLQQDLGRLVEDRKLRRELGRAGREFVLAKHSYDAVASGWEAVLAHLWRGRALPADLSPSG